LEEDFLFFWPAQLSHAAKRTFLSPDSKVQDGLFKVIFIRAKKVSRLRFALILLGLETGTHVSYDDVVEVVDCCAYRLEPLTPGLSVLDGEVLPSGPIQARVLPAALKVFCHRPTD
jgi:diacylglycerol kinase family enzyme